MLSRKHYVDIAFVLNTELTHHSGDHSVEAAVREITVSLARTFKQDNSRFDRQRFFDAVTEGTTAERIIA